VCLVLSILCLPALTWAQEPADSGVQEKVTVTLVQLDALVMNKQGQTVPDLGKDDFELRIGEQPLEIDAVDVVCPIGAADDPLAVKGRQLPPPVAPGVKRRIVLAFDYYFLSSTMRPQILEAAQAMLQGLKTDEEEVMIVALAYGVRVEQRFTSNLRDLSLALRRMEHDVTLWAMEFGTGASGETYFKDMVALMDVLGGYDGSKAVVLFSQAKRIPTRERLDLWFNNVAMHAAASRTAIYPANPDLLLSSGHGSDSLARFANQTGGRMPFFTGDLSVPYRWAQRDLSCRYTVAAYLDREEGRQRRSVHLSVKESGSQVRHAEMIKLFTDEERAESRKRAAFVDPGPYENPLVRAFAFPVFPATASAWDTLVALNFPMPVEADGTDVNVEAILRRDGTRVDKYKRQFRVDPPAGGGSTRPVTLFGDTKLKGGGHSLVVALSKPDGAEVVSATANFFVPEVLNDLLILRGPILARVVPGGMLIRADPKDAPNDTELDKILGGDNSFEPLLVNEIEPTEELLVYWAACVRGKLNLKGDAVVKRRLMTEEGETAKELDEIPLKLESRGKKLTCHNSLESIPAGTLTSGEYELDVMITHANGDLISHGRAPLSVK
jgi:VWFA-related protein